MVTSGVLSWNFFASMRFAGLNAASAPKCWSNSTLNFASFASRFSNAIGRSRFNLIAPISGDTVSSSGGKGKRSGRVFRLPLQPAAGVGLKGHLAVFVLSRSAQMDRSSTVTCVITSHSWSEATMNSSASSASLQTVSDSGCPI